MARFSGRYVICRRNILLCHCEKRVLVRRSNLSPYLRIQRRLLRSARNDTKTQNTGMRMTK